MVQPPDCVDQVSTRQAALARDGKDVQDKPDSCQPASGTSRQTHDFGEDLEGEVRGKARYEIRGVVLVVLTCRTG
ncbi:hypothetical protein [Streptomyces olivochromogenes]|uniref:hypothetical protein n=1 Tax=Streptomyces olivochromogenes TaxID=1963 RepID=UPI001F1C9790|nr:hypothetical protein [Streptomyces olivochromogenes]